MYGYTSFRPPAELALAFSAAANFACSHCWVARHEPFVYRVKFCPYGI